MCCIFTRCTVQSYCILCINIVYFVFIQCTVYLYCVRFFGCFPFQSVLGVPAVCSVGDKGRAGICLTFSRRFCPKRLTVIQIYIQYIYTYWWQWLPCKMPTSTSVEVWGSVSCPRTGERRNQSSNLLIARHWATEWSLCKLCWISVCRPNMWLESLCCYHDTRVWCHRRVVDDSFSTNRSWDQVCVFIRTYVCVHVGYNWEREIGLMLGLQQGGRNSCGDTIFFLSLTSEQT